MQVSECAAVCACTYAEEAGEEQAAAGVRRHAGEVREAHPVAEGVHHHHRRQLPRGQRGA